MPDAESIELRIEDAGQTMLASAGKGLSGFNLDGFFQVGHEERTFHRLEALEGCNLFDLHISLYFGTTATHLGMAHTGIFEDFFPEMMRRLAGGATTLTLWIRDLSLEYFEELDVVQSYLLPEGVEVRPSAASGAVALRKDKARESSVRMAPWIP